MRPKSKIHEQWWDYTTLDREILEDAARLTVRDIEALERPGFSVRIYDTREAFFAAEALEYVKAWKQATSSNPVGVCGPIGPTEQLPIVAQMVNDLDVSLKHCHFWGMDEWVVDGASVGIDNPLSFAKADMDLCFSRIRPELRMPK
ncbi:MAG: glucosamine-6-phosphate isomerase, partial [Spirochaetales bacterium]|nr:glucosamine-6-phosphate isomerase [Spirochaetales bacterium]